MSLSALDQLAVSAGDFQGITYSTGGTIAYKNEPGHKWCAASIVPITTGSVSLAQNPVYERQYAVSLAYSKNPGKFSGSFTRTLHNVLYLSASHLCLGLSFLMIGYLVELI